MRDLHDQMEYVKTVTKCPDGKVLGLGHSMGGIILYAMLATRGKGAISSSTLLIQLISLCGTKGSLPRTMLSWFKCLSLPMKPAHCLLCTCIITYFCGFLLILDSLTVKLRTGFYALRLIK